MPTISYCTHTTTKCLSFSSFALLPLLLLSVHPYFYLSLSTPVHSSCLLSRHVHLSPFVPHSICLSLSLYPPLPPTLKLATSLREPRAVRAPAMSSWCHWSSSWPLGRSDRCTLTRPVCVCVCVCVCDLFLYSKAS